MGQSINIPRQDGNARFDTLQVKLIESSSLIRTVVADNNGKFYYSTSGGGGGTTGTNGTSGTSGINGANGTNGTSGTTGTSGTSGVSGAGFNTINNAGTGRILLSDGTVNAATASSALVYNNNELTISGSTIITGSLTVIGHVSASSFTGSLFGTASYVVSASYAPNIYNSDGELTGNRTISASFYSLNLISTKSTGSTFTVSHIQTQSNAIDTADIGMQVAYNISASSATNQLVARAFQLSVSNNLTGGGILQNLRVFNLAAFFPTGTTTGDADLVYLERGTATGTISNYRAIRIANYAGTNRGGIAMAAIGGTGNAAYINMGSIVIPNGRWGIYQSETAISNYLAGDVSIGTSQTGSYKLSILGSTGISNGLTATGSILFPSLTQAAQNNVVLIDTSTGQLHYTASSALISTSASYASTASYALFAVLAATASYVDPANLNLTLFQIATGSVTASVDTNPNNLFLIKSGSTQYFNISSSGDTDLYSNLFIVRNFTTQQPVLIVSQSIVQIQTQSLNPIGTTNAGSIWFTSSSFYVGLE
jgi:hypothetical protein